MEWVDLQLQCLDGYELHTVIMPRTAQEAGARRSFNGFVGVKPAIGCLILRATHLRFAEPSSRSLSKAPTSLSSWPSVCYRLPHIAPTGSDFHITFSSAEDHSMQ